MDSPLAALVLAAGLGTRLRPLSDLRPKALCPVGNVPLVDLALERVRPLVASTRLAVNVHHHADLLDAHLAGACDVYVSHERAVPLGTAGAVGHLRDWLDGAPVLVVNADAWSTMPLAPLLDGWDATRVRLLGFDRPGDLGVATFAGASLLPGPVAAALPAEPAGLYEVVWRKGLEEGTADVVTVDGAFVDCGTPERYLLANLTAAGRGGLVAARAAVDASADVDASVVGAGATVGAGASVVRSVVWDGASVVAGERLDRCVRADAGVTVGPLDVH